MDKLYPIRLFVKKLHDDAIIPDISHEGDTGYNLYATEGIMLASLQTYPVPIGIAIELEKDIADIQIRSRSSMAKKGMLCHTGTIDWGFRGELMATITNVTPNPYQILKGDKVAQLVMVAKIMPTVEPVMILCDSARGTQGWGSTGR